MSTSDLPEATGDGERSTIERIAALERRVAALEEVPTTSLQPTIHRHPSDRTTRSVIAARLAALAHPSRLELLAAIDRGAVTTAELVRALGTGSTGQLYHHLNQLVAAGWIGSAGRGRYQIPADRRRTLTTILSITAEH